MAGARVKGSKTKTKAKKKKTYTPVMLQFLAAKEAHPDSLLFFRLGDFYEMFFEDAYRAAELLGITQTFRGTDPNGERIAMAGVPHHAAAGYITRALKQGQKVAICEQMADPSTVKGVVPREVVRVITPALCLEDDALDAGEDNYLVALHATEDAFGLAAFEMSTGNLRACSLPDHAAIIAELARLAPREVLFPSEGLEVLYEALEAGGGRAVLRRESHDTKGVLEEALGDEETVLEGPARDAAALALAYARKNLAGGALQVQRVGHYDPRSHLVLDDVAVRNLELVRTLAGEKSGSLLHTIDKTKTSMGARLLRRRILTPLLDIAAIRRRHDRVEAFVLDGALRDEMRDTLAGMPDLERLATRATAGVASPRDLGSVREALRRITQVRALLSRSAGLDDALVDALPEEWGEGVLRRLETQLVDEPPATIRDGGIIRPGVDEKLDQNRELSQNAKDVILKIELRERERTGISSLKIRFNRVFGYYIEVTRTHLGSVPDDYTRKQTIANGERFVTEELSGLQDRIALADETSKKIEGRLFQEVLQAVADAAFTLRSAAAQVAALDVDAALADVAVRYGYCRPEVSDGSALELVESRHPVVERLVASGAFVPNDVKLDTAGERFMVLTGPNMSGKSTTMRQVALVVILAQAGSFVPADSARIGLVDRVFTRVGASDNLAAGQSTFMVEMQEAAEILRNATSRSLVILDEVGRGTSTYDGLAIAWAIAEHLHDAVCCRGIFATHYHELCELSAVCEGAVNYNVSAKEYGGEVVFLHKLTPGGANRSYGVAVARLAGVPAIVLARARALLGDLEDGSALPSGAPARVRGLDSQGRAQLELFAPPAPAKKSRVLDTLAELDVDHMTPVDALVALARLRQLLAAESDEPGE